MQRTLVVVRHGRAEKNTLGSDYDRPLTLQGRRDVHRLGEWMARKGLLPNLVLSSPSVRTEETVEVLLRAWGREDELEDPEQVIWDERLHDATGSVALQCLRETPAGTRRVLMVGHNPSLTDVVEHLVAGELPLSKTGKVLTPGTAAVLKMPAAWHELPEGCATLLHLVRPDEV